MHRLQRYRDGEHEQVWAEMLAAGPGIREDAAAWEEAQAVARETMLRVRENVAHLARRLPEVGYRFADPGRVLVAPAPDAAGQMDRLEARVGPVPLAFRAFHEVVGSVDLSGAHPLWRHETPDPLMFELYVDYLIGDIDVRIAEELEPPDGPFELDFAPDDLHKANISGGAPYAMQAPDAAVDGLVQWELHRTTLVGYLRIVLLRCAGFGGIDPRRGAIQPPELRELARELQPF